MSAESSSAFNIEHLKKEAKRRLQACRAGDPDAVAALQALLARLRRLDPAAVPASVRLADVQHGTPSSEASGIGRTSRDSAIPLRVCSWRSVGITS